MHCRSRGIVIRHGPGLDKNQQLQGAYEPFTLARKADELAKQIKKSNQPGDLDTRPAATEIVEAPDPVNFDIALDEEGRDRNAAVHEIASRALESIQSRRAGHPGKPDYNLMREREGARFKWSWLRCRVATRLADDLRKEGSEAARMKALEYMREAESDIKNCRRYVDNFTKAPREMHWVEGIRTLAMLTYGELEIDLDRLQSAETHLRLARHAIGTYKELSGQLERNDPRSLSYLNENLKVWEQRLNESFDRIGSRRQAKAPHEHSSRLKAETASIVPATGR